MSDKQLLYVNLKPETHPISFHRLAISLDSAVFKEWKDTLNMNDFLPQLKAGKAEENENVAPQLIEGRILEAQIKDSGLEIVFFSGRGEEYKQDIHFNYLADFKHVATVLSAMASHSVITTEQAVAGMQIFTEYQVRQLLGKVSPLGAADNELSFRVTRFENNAVGAREEVPDVLADIAKGHEVSKQFLALMKEGQLTKDGIVDIVQGSSQAAVR